MCVFLMRMCHIHPRTTHTMCEKTSVAGDSDVLLELLRQLDIAGQSVLASLHKHFLQVPVSK